MRYFLLLSFVSLLSLFSESLYAQNKYTIKGKIVDAVTEEWLPGVSIGLAEYSQQGTFSSDAGNYSLTLDPGQYTLVFRLLGFHVQEVKVDLVKNQTLNINLQPEALSLQEIEISAQRKDENVKSIQMGVERLEIETVNKIPVLLGEKDILKTLQLLPGVQTAGEGNTGFYVRGGSSDQNLILLDNATVYNPSHLFGFFSTFNSDAVDNMTIYKGSMPSQYGGRLSSTLDVSMRDGDMQKFVVGGGIGLISSKLTLEGPIQKEKSSFIVSGRRTYADAIGRAMGVKAVKSSTLYFYDLNAKLSYVLSENDKLTLSLYKGIDKLGMSDITNFDWGNSIASLKWNHRFNNKLSSNTAFTITDYTYNVAVNLTSRFTVKSYLTDYNFNQEFSFYPNDMHALKAGFSSVYHYSVPNRMKTDDPSAIIPVPFADRFSWENAAFVSDNIKLDDKLELGLGLRFTAASTLGGGAFYEYDANGEIAKMMNSKRGDFVKTYFNFEPRLSAAYQLNSFSSIKGAYNRTTQNMHMLKVSNMESTPTDRWIFNTNYIKPEIADQVSLGYFRNFNDNNYEFSAEVYYKDLRNQMDYKDGTTDVFKTENLEPFLLFGKGRAYGLELFLKKRYGRFNGWIGYTLSKSEKKIDGINNGNWYVSNQDRTHDVSVVGIYELNKKWTLSGTWVYTTGAPMTFPSAKYVVGQDESRPESGHTVYYYEGRNLYRAPAYHRLDLGATCILKKTKKYHSELVFSIYNAYGRKNPYMYDFRQNKDNSSLSEVSMIYLFSVIPSISWNFKF